MTSALIYQLTIWAVFLPLLGSCIAGFFAKPLGPKGAHRVTITLMLISFILAVIIAKAVLIDQITLNSNLYIWGKIKDNIQFEIGFLIDQLSAVMLVVVTFVSLLVHVYSIGYMCEDPGYQRFFSYISMFTFAMLMLVTANNFLQLFFGWEGVGLASYLLIGFWFSRESANQGSLKAFMVNRVGDFGFILGIAALLTFVGSLNYQEVFAIVPNLANPMRTIALFPGIEWSVITVICILLFVGAMGKSAQIPLHVWLPESMEGPTPISALIHAATMVTAGIYMVARMSPLFELSNTALSVVLIIGATGALFTGLLAIVQTDIKRVIAYSTLSQLGYMVAALGVSAYAVGIFHLVTHAAFKALLFLGAGSVIIALHHEQDMRKMGQLAKYMPITYITFLIGAIALCALPPFSGYYSKDAIIEAIWLSQIPGAKYAYVCVLLGTFVTAFYTTRAFILTFHGQSHVDKHHLEHLHESPRVVWVPLVLLAIPSVIAGVLWVEPMVYDQVSLFGNTLTVLPAHDVMSKLREEYSGLWALTTASISTPAFWLVLLGIVSAWLSYQKYPKIPDLLSKNLPIFYKLLMHKYGFDEFNQRILVNGAKEVGEALYYTGDLKIIDDKMVNGSGRLVQWVANVSRKLQTGYLYHYAFAMVIGLFGFLIWVLLV